jgi:hypothetical protein
VNVLAWGTDTDLTKELREELAEKSQQLEKARTDIEGLNGDHEKDLSRAEQKLIVLDNEMTKVKAVSFISNFRADDTHECTLQELADKVEMYEKESYRIQEAFEARMKELERTHDKKMSGLKKASETREKVVQSELESAQLKFEVSKPNRLDDCVDEINAL